MKGSFEQRLAALEAAVDPQTMRNALERTWDPRGGEPRVIDAAGHTLDYQGAIQFLNATATIDPVAQRVIVTPTGGGGGGGMAGVFSPDAVTDDTERLKFTDSATPTINHYVIDTLTLGATRVVETILAEDTTAPAGQFAATVLTEDGAGIGSIQELAAGEVQSAVSLIARELIGFTTSSVTVEADAGSLYSAALRAGPSSIELNDASPSSGLAAAALVIAAAPVPSRTFLDETGQSSYVQLGPHGNDDSPTRCVMRGPFIVPMTPLAAGAQTTIPVANVWSASASAGSKVIAGGLQGVPGDELCQWSWAVNGLSVDQVDITVTNTGAVARFPILSFFSFGDA